MNFESIKKEIAYELSYIDEVFPGTQPVSLDYTNIKNISDNYVVSLKYDGIRKMLYSKSNTSFLFDRKYNYTHTRILLTEGLTILDGEEVNDVFIVFDCVVIDGLNVRKYDLSRRILELKSYLNKYNISLNIKIFYPLSDFNRVIKIKDLPCDGYIFTNVQNIYTAGRDERLYKYKDGKDNTIDFACFKHSDVYELYCGSLGKDVVWIGYALNKDNIIVKEGKTIVECYWSDESNAWIIKKERRDKINSNDIKIVRWNIRTIENNIKLKDLQNIIDEKFSVQKVN